MKFSLSGKTSCRILGNEKLWRFKNVLKKRLRLVVLQAKPSFFNPSEVVFVFYPVVFPIDNESFGVEQDRGGDGRRQLADIDETG